MTDNQPYIYLDSEYASVMKNSDLGKSVIYSKNFSNFLDELDEIRTELGSERINAYQAYKKAEQSAIENGFQTGFVYRDNTTTANWHLNRLLNELQTLGENFCFYDFFAEDYAHLETTLSLIPIEAPTKEPIFDLGF